MAAKKNILLSFLILFFLARTAVAYAVGETTTRLSVSSGGVEGDSWSSNPIISDDGRYVVFFSNASNLTPGDTNGAPDIFVRDLQTNAITNITFSVPTPHDFSYISTSRNGRYITYCYMFKRTIPGVGQMESQGTIYRYDRQSGGLSLIGYVTPKISSTLGVKSHCGFSSASDDGAVAFPSTLSTLVPGDTNNAEDVFVKNGASIQRASLSSSGAQGNGDSVYPVISADGRYVAFVSAANNLTSTPDSNGMRDVFVRDLSALTTTLVSVNLSGGAANGASSNPSISSDGRYIAFVSTASNIVGGDSNAVGDIFVRDMQSGISQRASVDDVGTQASLPSSEPFLSGNGRYVAFTSSASNLTSGDFNGKSDVFVRDLQNAVTTRASLNSNGNEANGHSSFPSVTSDGLSVAFSSYATNLVSDDTNNTQDIFLRKTPPPTPPTVSAAVPPDGSVLAAPPLQITVYFNKDVLADGGLKAANYTGNYVLVEDGSDDFFDSASCASPDFVNDAPVSIDSVAYSNSGGIYQATLSINGGTALPAGTYRLFVCGTTSIYDLQGIVLNGGSDSVLNFTVLPSSSGGGSPVVSAGFKEIPSTGFAPGVLTRLIPQPKELAYWSYANLRLEIPAIKVKANIVGVPAVSGAWDVTWLGNQVGWLAGTAFPTWDGNSVLTAHVWNYDNTPGVFFDLHRLKWDDEIIIRLQNQSYVYQVRDMQYISPENVASMLKRRDSPWLTLVTCRRYDEQSKKYLYRLLVRAKFLEIR